METIEIPNCTLVMIDTRAQNLAVRTLSYQADLCKFDDIVLLTNIVDCDDDRIRIYRINKIKDVYDYNRCITRELYKAINTSHVLVTQCDGYIVNPKAWNNDWLNYDYIGAPWPYFPFKGMPSEPMSTPGCAVGGGGFSLRSKRLLETVAELSKQYNDKEMNPEDVLICRKLKNKLLESGFKWPSEALAWRFSCENTIYNNQFGFHGHTTLKINPSIPMIVKHCIVCDNKPPRYCTNCGRGGIESNRKT